jgi:16S rRNA (guanine966-N2)-methyltransferase
VGDDHAVRVIAGKYGGRRLQAPRGRVTRPTSDRVREALFSMLGGPMSAGLESEAGTAGAARLQGAVVLDLFAGTGALAIEALSRGAERAVLIERDPRALEVLKANLAELGLGPETAEVRRADALAALRNARERAETYDLVFVDPPYRHAGVLGRELREALPPLLAPRARVVTESDRRTELPLRSPLLEVETQRRYGDTVITIQRRR